MHDLEAEARRVMVHDVTGAGDWLDVQVAGVEIEVALDCPRWLSPQWLARRTLARVLDTKTICHGNTGTRRQMLGSDAIIRRHFRSFTRLGEEHAR